MKQWNTIKLKLEVIINAYWTDSYVKHEGEIIRKQNHSAYFAEDKIFHHEETSFRRFHGDMTQRCLRYPLWLLGFKTCQGDSWDCASTLMMLGVSGNSRSPDWLTSCWQESCSARLGQTQHTDRNPTPPGLAASKRQLAGGAQSGDWPIPSDTAAFTTGFSLPATQSSAADESVLRHADIWTGRNGGDRLATPLS
jgi:hypothetical protein